MKSKPEANKQDGRVLRDRFGKRISKKHKKKGGAQCSG